jgi:HD-GYP domain-containing protein (c-di-GMP phosphodiesterase class II)
MIGRLSIELIADVRESILSEALTELPSAQVKDLESCGVDARETLFKLLDYMTSQDGDGAATELLDEAVGLCWERNVPWTCIAGLIETLGKTLLGFITSRGEGRETANLYGELNKAQTYLFQAYLRKERERRERMGKRQREIDRFPDTIAATLDPSTLIKAGLSKIKEFIPIELCALFSIHADGRLALVEGDKALSILRKSLPALKGEAAEKLLHRGECYIEEIPREGSCLETVREKCDIHSLLLVPIVARGRTTGVLLLSDGPRKRHFTAEETEIAGRFSNRMAVAMENAYLHSKEQHKIKETVALLEIARVINSTLDLQEILDKVVKMTVDLCGVVLCVVYLLAEGEERFLPGAYCGFIEDALWEEERLSGFALMSLQAEEKDGLARGEAVAMPSSQDDKLLSDEVLYEHGVESILMFPLSSKESLTGIFALFYPKVVGELEREEIEVVGAIAAQASLAIENAALYEDIERSYFSTVKALARAIEVKDPYTHGHSERVTEYALLIAEAMELDEREKQKLKYAATLHDIGKIGIAGRVLNKPGALTDEEYLHVKTHPLLGDTIVEPVEFLQGPRPIILHHHERFDGKGYPDGLKGNDIPLSARILSVADAFEAMRSDRPYRKALSLESALEELMRNSGSQFDPGVVQAFLSILQCLESGPGEGEGD